MSLALALFAMSMRYRYLMKEMGIVQGGKEVLEEEKARLFSKLSGLKKNIGAGNELRGKVLNTIPWTDLKGNECGVFSFIVEVENILKRILSVDEVVIDVARGSDIFNIYFGKERFRDVELRGYLKKMWKYIRLRKHSKKEVRRVGPYYYCVLSGYRACEKGRLPFGLIAVNRASSTGNVKKKLKKVTEILETIIYILFIQKKTEIVTLLINSIEEKYVLNPLSDSSEGGSIFRSFCKEIAETIEKYTDLRLESVYCKYLNCERTYLDHEGLQEIFSLRAVYDTIQQVSLDFQVTSERIDVLLDDASHRQAFQKLFTELNKDKTDRGGAIYWPLITKRKDNNGFHCPGILTIIVRNSQWVFRESDKNLIYMISRQMDKTIKNFIINSIDHKKVLSELMDEVTNDFKSATYKFLDISPALTPDMQKSFWKKAESVILNVPPGLYLSAVSYYIKNYLIYYDRSQPEDLLPVLKGIERMKPADEKDIVSIGRELDNEIRSYLYFCNPFAFRKYYDLIKFLTGRGDRLLSGIASFSYSRMISVEELEDIAELLYRCRGNLKRYGYHYEIDREFQNIYQKHKNKWKNNHLISKLCGVMAKETEKITA